MSIGVAALSVRKVDPTQLHLLYTMLILRICSFVPRVFWAVVTPKPMILPCISMVVSASSGFSMSVVMKVYVVSAASLPMIRPSMSSSSCLIVMYVISSRT